jgi:hypothetical protein
MNRFVCGDPVVTVDSRVEFAALKHYTVNVTTGVASHWNGLDRTQPGWEEKHSWRWPSREHLMTGYVEDEPWFCKPGDTIEFVEVVVEDRNYHGLSYQNTIVEVVGSIIV